MGRFTPVDDADKAALKERALKLKPRYVANVVATPLGWGQTRPNGSTEILVCFHGLDELLGDASTDQDVTAEPVEVTAEPAPAEDEVADQATEEQAATEETPKKKGGRPKKADVAAAADTATEEKAAE